jgi:Domain of unknown function (DUF3291)
MTRWHIAQLNVARLRETMDHPDTADFANATAIEYPGDPNRINNTSVWESVEALRDLTFDKAHVGFMRRRLDWFEKRTGPHFVMWWVPTGQVPTLEEADQRLRLLGENGPSAEAFTFLLTFPPPA